MREILRRGLRALPARKDGNIAIIFGFSLPLLIGAGGIAVDYGNAVRIRAMEASVGDATALLVAGADTVAAATEGFRLAEAQLGLKLGTANTVSGYKVTGSWLDGSNYRLVVSTTMKTSFVHLLPGVSKQITISTATTVNRTAPIYEMAAPSITQLAPDAADYNRIYMYCYSSDPARQAAADQGRRGLTAIADNAGSDYSKPNPPLPICGANEVVSYMLRNVRWARTSPSKWDDNTQEIYQYYADTTIDTALRVQSTNMKGYRVNSDGTLTAINMVNNQVLETIVCDNLIQCVSQNAGGILPNGNTRHTPATATTSCSEGKFMYYGWEDRPPLSGSSDFDYDDIRLVVSCPKQVKVADKKLRIVE